MSELQPSRDERLREDGFYVVGSGVAVRAEEDGSLSFQVNAIGKAPDPANNYTSRCTPAQAAAFRDWLEEQGHEEDHYKGSEGWLVVAVGHGGRACILDVDPKFGAARWFLNEADFFDPEDDWGLRLPGDPGVYRGKAKAWTSRSWEGEHDMGFELVGEWVHLFPW